MASFTQSAGLPLTAYPVPFSKGCFVRNKGSKRVMEWPVADLWLSGATIYTSYSSLRTSYIVCSPCAKYPSSFVNKIRIETLHLLYFINRNNHRFLFLFEAKHKFMTFKSFIEKIDNLIHL